MRKIRLKKWENDIDEEEEEQTRKKRWENKTMRNGRKWEITKREKKNYEEKEGDEPNEKRKMKKTETMEEDTNIEMKRERR